MYNTRLALSRPNDKFETRLFKQVTTAYANRKAVLSIPEADAQTYTYQEMFKIPTQQIQIWKGNRRIMLFSYWIEMKS